MKGSLDTFHLGLSDLEEFLRSETNERLLVQYLAERDASRLATDERALLNEVVSVGTVRKRFVYALSIVSLYGLLERFLDSIIEEYVDRLSKAFSTYAALPEKLRENHLRFSLEMAKRINDDRWRSHTEEAVVSNLHACLSGSSTFKLNSFAFSARRGNASTTKISEQLSGVCISHPARRIVLSSIFRSYLSSIGDSTDVERAPDEEVQNKLGGIDDLVERRNEVAHGVLNISQIESIELLEARGRFVKAYVEALHSVLLREALKYEIDLGKAISLGKPIATYNHAIICFHKTTCAIARGTHLAYLTGKELNPIQFGAVSTIEVDGTPTQEIEPSMQAAFGLKVAFRAIPDVEYFVLPDTALN